MEFTVLEFVDGDVEMALLNDSGDVIFSGDDYHDKIQEKINGFFLGIKYAGMMYDVTYEEVSGSLEDSEYLKGDA